MRILISFSLMRRARRDRRGVEPIASRTGSFGHIGRNGFGLAALRLGMALLIPAMAIVVSPQARAEARDVLPYELVRSLETLQNDAANGNTAAYSSRPKLVAQIAERFLAADKDVWRDVRNARALAIYVLSGGQPSVLRKVIELDVLPKEDADLMKGTLAYAEGRESEARQLLVDVNPQTLPPSLGGQLALVQANLLMAEDRDRAMALLAVARLLMPGTLVEDVALRREILAMAERRDVDKFLSLSEQYARRFRHSVYADNFWQSFAYAVAKLSPPIDAAARSRLEILVGMLGPDGQRNVYLSIAQISAISGNTSLALFTSEHAASLCQDGSVDKARAALYGAAAMVVTDDYDAGLKTLDGIAKTKLAPRDEQLRQGVLAVAREVRRLPPPVEPRKDVPITQGVAEKTPAALQLTETAALIDSVESRVAEIDQLLKASPK